MPSAASENARDSLKTPPLLAVGQGGRSTAAAWTIAVERGPDWLFVRPGPPPTGVDGSLCDAIWEMLSSNRSKRVVVELDSV